MLVYMALTSLITVTSVLPHYEKDSLSKKYEQSISYISKEKRIPLAEMHGRTGNILWNVIKTCRSSKVLNASMAPIRLNHCSYLRGGCQANQPATWQEPRIQPMDQIVRDKDSEMAVQESAQNLPNSDPTKYSGDDSKMNLAPDESAKFEENQGTSIVQPDTGSTNVALKEVSSANPRDPADALRRRDFELAQLFQSGSCRREDIDDRCMKFIHDVDPNLAAEVASPRPRAAHGPAP